MPNILNIPLSGTIFFSATTAGTSTVPSLTGQAVSLAHDNIAGLVVSSLNTATSATNRFRINGANGALLAVTDEVTGTVFSVNDPAGLPIISADTGLNDVITMGTFGSNALVVRNDRVGVGTSNPNTSSALEITSTTRGFLPPRMTSTQRNVISGANVPSGLTVFNSTDNALSVYTTVLSTWDNVLTSRLSGFTADTLRTACSQTQGTGSLVFATSPTITTPTINTINQTVGNPFFVNSNYGTSTLPSMVVRNAGVNGLNAVGFQSSSFVTNAFIGYANASSTNYPDQAFFCSVGKLLSISTAFGSRHLVMDTTGSVTIGSGLSANSSAVLELSSTSKGFLPPRMTSTQRNAISGPTIPSGLMVFNSTDDALSVYTTALSTWDNIFTARAGSFTSDTLRNACSNDTGTGNLVFSDNPTLSGRVNITGNLSASGALSASSISVAGNVTVSGGVTSNSMYVVSMGLSTDVTANNGTDTPLVFPTLKLDPSSWTSVNGSNTRITPTVQGYYSVVYQLAWKPGTAGSGAQNNIQILRNETTVSLAQQPIHTSTTVNTTLVTTALVYMNGTTDYLTFQAYSSNAAQVIIGDSNWSKVEMYKVN